MKLKFSQLICLLLLITPPLYADDDCFAKREQLKLTIGHKDDDFIAKREQLKPYYGIKNVVMIASPGRSGSTLLTNVTKKYASKYKVLKTHLLPPDTRYKGKILFIFSNPDRAAESALHLILNSKSHGATHFSHVETADQLWFQEIGRNGNNQTETHNLLAYDALGCVKQLEEWLHERSQPCDPQEAQILAIKYEHLWDFETIEAIKKFLKLKSFTLPPKRERGHEEAALFPEEMTFRKIYNLGTEEEPLYRAYDKARELCEQAPAFQYLKIAY